jgi:hypothetical protein
VLVDIVKTILCQNRWIGFKNRTRNMVCRYWSKLQNCMECPGREALTV